MIWKKSFILLFSCSYLVDASKPIDVDYYLSYLRNSDCNSKEGLHNCEKSCKGVPVICHDGECYCHQSVVEGPSNPSVAVLTLAQKKDVQIKTSSQMTTRRDEAVSEVMLTKEALRPALRHQIAHFCPDLHVARKCIRTCIKEGKPAFCGKDHKCYCGHRYGSDDKNIKPNVLDVYKQYADMYAKYLGNAGTNDDDDSDDK